MPKTVLSMLLAAAFGLASIQPIAAATDERDTFNATKDTRAAEARKKADCDRQARAHHFGVHLGSEAVSLNAAWGLDERVPLRARPIGGRKLSPSTVSGISEGSRSQRTHHRRDG